MQTRPYKDLFRLITSMIGTGGELPGSGTEDTQVADFLNRRFQQAFDTSPVWPRYLVTSEPRTITPEQTIPLSEDGFYIYGSGTPDIHGLYQYGPEYSNHNSYILNGNSLSFRITDTTRDSRIVGTYKLDASYQISNSFNRGVWVNQDNPNIVFTSDTAQASWRVYDIAADSEIDAEGSSAYFPWNTDSFNFFGTFVGYPSVAYNIERNASNNHWELMQQNADGTAIVLYKDGNGGTPSETGWEIVNARNPSPIVHDLENIGDFVRIHRNQAFLNLSSPEYDFSVDLDGANILNIRNTEDSSAYVTYKREFTPFTVTSDFYNSTVEVPGEFFNFIAHAVYADFLRVQNRQQEAIAEEQVAQTYLAQELEKIDIRNNNNTVNKRFSTYVNRQSR